jgi:Ubiquitin elongating factor core
MCLITYHTHSPSHLVSFVLTRPPPHLHTQVPVSWALLPEWLVEDMVSYVTFLARHRFARSLLSAGQVCFQRTKNAVHAIAMA